MVAFIFEYVERHPHIRFVCLTCWTMDPTPDNLAMCLVLRFVEVTEISMGVILVSLLSHFEIGRQVFCVFFSSQHN